MLDFDSALRLELSDCAVGALIHRYFRTKVRSRQAIGTVKAVQGSPCGSDDSDCTADRKSTSEEHPLDISLVRPFFFLLIILKG